MTAFASGEVEFEGLLINCEIRSVNHRYLDVSIKIPERLRFAEAELRTIINGKLSRGKIECALNYKKQSAQQNILIDYAAVSALLEATKIIQQQMQSAATFSALDILAFPGIQKDLEPDKLELSDSIYSLVANTLDKLSESRTREGQQLKHLIVERCNKIRDLVNSGIVRAPEVILQQRKKIIDRLNDLQQEPNFDRLEQELVYISQKLDVSEELDRLKTHTTEVMRVIEQSEPVGRRLDFLMQELNREANTLGSKSTDIDMTQISIELKVLIEQIREQVQNIE
jgi:uncharacterized protein (TIGR00255 family)